MSTLFYSISIILLFVLFLMIKKTEKKMDIIPIGITIFLCILAYQVLICCFFSMVTIAINLTNLAIVNMVFCIFLAIGIKQKGMQSFQITKKDGMVVFLLIIIISMISYKNVGNLENIRYYSTDASIHYIAAKEFYQNEQMLNKTENTETSNQMMPIAYVNVGILFKALSPIIGEMNLYKVFLFFDITIFCFSGVLFYFIIKDKIKNKWYLLLAVIITIIYLLGYPLNNLLSGFYYLGIGCLMINSILYMMIVIEQKIALKRVILFYLNTGLILSYSLFAPVVYLSIFLYDGYRNKKIHKKIINKEFVINTITTLVIPGLIGVFFLLVPNIETVKYIAQEGYIYKNLWINIIFFVPFAGYAMISMIRSKKTDYTFVYFLTLIGYMLILYIGTKGKMVSEYYFYKNAYILWSILLIYFFYGVATFLEKYQKNKIIPIAYIGIYVVILLLTILTHRHIFTMFDIYEDNISLINHRENITQDDINMLSYIYDNNLLSKTENNVLFIGDFMQEAWIRSIFTYRNRYPLEARNHATYIEKWNRGEIDYLVCFENSVTYSALKDICQVEESKILFCTSHAKIYTK